MYRLMLIRPQTGTPATQNAGKSSDLPDRVVAARGKRMAAKNAAEREE